MIIGEKVKVVREEFDALFEADIGFDGLIDFINETRFKPVVINAGTAANGKVGKAFFDEEIEEFGAGEVSKNGLSDNIVVLVAELPVVGRGKEGGVGSVDEIKTFWERFGHGFKSRTTHDESADFTGQTIEKATVFAGSPTDGMFVRVAGNKTVGSSSDDESYFKR